MSDPQPPFSCVSRNIIRAVGKANRWSEDLCGRPAEKIIGGLTLCEGHTLDWRGHQQFEVHEIRAREKKARLEEAARKARNERWAEERRVRVAATTLANAGPSVVYYVRRESDGLIKIGTSASFPNRLAGLRSQHGPLQVLATHSGDRGREHRMHKFFADLRVRGEWFRLEEPLMSWIVKVRRSHRNRHSVLPMTVPLGVVMELTASLPPEQAARSAFYVRQLQSLT